jgi:hypothetical protein
LKADIVLGAPTADHRTGPYACRNVRSESRLIAIFGAQPTIEAIREA